MTLIMLSSLLSGSHFNKLLVAFLVSLYGLFVNNCVDYTFAVLHYAPCMAEYDQLKKLGMCARFLSSHCQGYNEWKF